MPTPVLDRRRLNRALLERHLLLRRRRADALETVERLVGLQAQVPRDPYVALWSRLDRFRPTALAEAVAERRAVRLTLMRGTLHLVTARDALAMRAVLQPVIERGVLGQRAFREAGEGFDRAEVLAEIRRLLDERPLTRSQVADGLAERWPERDTDSLAFWMAMIPTVQVTPRGIWGASGRSAITTIERWLGTGVEGSDRPDGLVLRYLATFGPATAADVQAWSGLRATREILERLAPRLRVLRDEDGRELVDVPDAPLPSGDTPAPVRFLPEYDNVLLGHKDRSRIAAGRVIPWIEVGWGAVLVDGWFTARWRLADGVLRIEPFRRLTFAERADVEAEADRLAAFLTDGAGADLRVQRFAG